MLVNGSSELAVQKSTVLLLTSSKSWKQRQCPSAGSQLTTTAEPDDGALRDGKNAQPIDAAACTKLQISVQNEKNQTSHEKEYTLCDFIYMKLQKIQTDLWDEKAELWWGGRRGQRRRNFRRHQGTSAVIYIVPT